LVDLVDHRPRGPGQPIGPGVQARSQDDRLPDTGFGGVDEEVVEKPCAHGHLLSPRAAVQRWVVFVQGDLSVDKTDKWGQAHRTHQRVGEGIVEQRIGSLRGQCA
jgi:hypothetical protein